MLMLVALSWPVNANDKQTTRSATCIVKSRVYFCCYFATFLVLVVELVHLYSRRKEDAIFCVSRRATQIKTSEGEHTYFRFYFLLFNNNACLLLSVLFLLLLNSTSTRLFYLAYLSRKYSFFYLRILFVSLINLVSVFALKLLC